MSATSGNAHVSCVYKNWYAPKNGYYEPPAGPVFGHGLDESKIRSRAEL